MRSREALAAVLAGRRALLVASTDLSHYHDARHRRRGSTASSSTASRDSIPTRCRLRSNAQPEHACGGGPTSR